MSTSELQKEIARWQRLIASRKNGDCADVPMRDCLEDGVAELTRWSEARALLADWWEASKKADVSGEYEKMLKVRGLAMNIAKEDRP